MLKAIMLLHQMEVIMTYSEKLNYAAYTFIDMLEEFPEQDPMEIAETVCFHWEIERLDLDERTWEIINNISPLTT